MEVSSLKLKIEAEGLKEISADVENLKEKFYELAEAIEEVNIKFNDFIHGKVVPKSLRL